MRSYLVESYVPRSHRRGVGAIGSRARAAAKELASEGMPIRYVRTTFLPDDETCFHLVETPARSTVLELCRRAGLGQARITRVVESS